MRLGKEFDNEARRAIVAEFDNSRLTKVEMARKYDIHVNTLLSWIKRFSEAGQTVTKILTDNEEKLVLELNREGLATEKIAEKLNVNVGTVRKVINFRGTTKVDRRTKYDDSYPQKMLDYFLAAHEKMEKAWNATDDKGRPVKKYIPLPTWEMFAIKELGIRPETLKKWVEKGRVQEEKDIVTYEELDYRSIAKTFDLCLHIYEEALTNGALNGVYQPVFSIFLAKNRTELKDIKAVELTGRDGQELFSGGTDQSKKKMDELENILGIAGPIEDLTDDQATEVLKQQKIGSDS